MKIVVVSPHRDDAAFSLGLSVGVWLDAGHAVEVIDVFTRSEYAPFSDAESLHPNDRMSFVSAVRKREDEAWVKLYVGQMGRGKLSLTDLNLKDAPLRLHCALDEVRSREPELTEKVVSKLQRAIERAKGDALVLPLGVGGHVDHLTVRAACVPADAQNVALAFYEELPDTAEHPEAVQGAVEASALQAGVPLSACFTAASADEDAAVKRKSQLAFCYDSQVDDATIARMAEFCRGMAGRERLWGNAAWMKVLRTTA